MNRYLLFILFTIFLLSSCLKRKAPTSLGGGAQINPFISFELLGPSQGRSANVSIVVRGIKGNGVLQFFESSACSTKIGEVNTLSAESLIVSNIFSTSGRHDIHYRFGSVTNCANTGINYSYVTTISTPSLFLSGTASTNSLTTINLQVSNLKLNATLYIYNGPSCINPIKTVSVNSSIIQVPVSGLQVGLNQFYANQIDSLGNISACSLGVNYTLDNVALPVSDFSLINPGPLTSPNNQRSVSIRIASLESSNAFVYLYSDYTCQNLIRSGTAFGNTILFNNISVPNDGIYHFYAIQVDSYGNYSNCSSQYLSYTLDTAKPTSPTLYMSSPALNISNNLSPIFGATNLMNGDTVNVFTSSNCTIGLVGTGSEVNSTAMISISGLSTEQTYTYYATTTDNAGNTSACSPTAFSYQLDLTPVVISNVGISLVTPASSPSNNVTPKIQVSGISSHDTVKIFNNSLCSNLIGTGVSTGLTIDIITNVLTTQGANNFYVQVIDLAGNTSACSPTPFIYNLDTIAPLVATSIALGAGSSPSNNLTPTISVTGGIVLTDIVKIYDNVTCQESGLLGTKTTGAGGIVSIISSALARGDGSYFIHAKSFDIAGNFSACSVAEFEYILDTTPPLPPGSMTLTSPATSPGNVANPVVSVDGLVTGDVLTLYEGVNCATLIPSTVSTPAVGTTRTIFPTNALTVNAAYEYHTKSTDPVGNISSCSSAFVNYVFDNVAPPAPTSITLVTPAASPGNIATPTIKVLNEKAQDTVTLYNGSCSPGTKLVNPGVTSGISTGTSVNITVGALADGTYNIYADQTDLAGNTSTCSLLANKLSYVLDTVPPNVPIPFSLAAGFNLVDNKVNPAIIVNGVANNDIIEVYSDASCSNLMGSATSTGATVTVTIDTLTINRSYSFYAKSTDLAGNSSACSTQKVNYTFDSISPLIPSSLALQNPTSSPGSVNTPTIRVNGVQSGDIVTIYSDSTCTTNQKTVTAADTFVDITLAVLSPDGAFTFFADATDLAGNKSGCSAVLDYVLNTATVAIPTGITVKAQAGITGPAPFSGSVSSPTFIVTGLLVNQTAKIYSGAGCASSALGSGVAIDVAGTPTAEVAISAISSSAAITYYAKVFNVVGTSSACSAVSVVYTYTNSFLSVTWNKNCESGINKTGGGYKVCVSKVPAVAPAAITIDLANANCFDVPFPFTAGDTITKSVDVGVATGKKVNFLIYGYSSTNQTGAIANAVGSQIISGAL